MSAIIELKNSNNDIYVMRDDLLPISFGGNKARKARLFFEDIRKVESDCVVTYGSKSSNHCRVVTNMASKVNLPCYIISPSEDRKETNNSKLVELLGAKQIEAGLDKIKETIKTTMEKLEKEGYDPYFIQGGGHGNLGTQAYVEAYQEILNYEERNNIKFDYIFHASGTGTTQAGLICGKLINGDDKKIIGISIARKNPYGKDVIFESVNSYMRSVGKKEIEKCEINFIDEYIVDGYGSYNEEIIETIKNMLREEGIALDTTYTGKAFWGMKEYIRKEKLQGKDILFIHTGGTPLFFDDLEELI